MQILKGLFKYTSAYVVVQVLTGIEMGVVFGFGIALFQWPAQTVATLMPLGLLLVVLQYPIVVWLIGYLTTRRTDETQSLPPTKSLQWLGDR